MKQHLILFVLFSVLISCRSDIKLESDNRQVATFYLIRHAEKDRTNSENHDPGLTEQGKLRAERWASYFTDIPLDAIYSTNYVRTRMTAMPVAQQKGLPVIQYDPGQFYSPDLVKNTLGKHILIVGHSNTTPELVNKLVLENKYPHMDDKDNHTLYIVRTDGLKHEVRTERIELN